VTNTASTSSQPLVDLQRLVVSIRRRRRLWLSAALLGLIVGGLLSVLVPTPPTAVAKILVTHKEDSPTDSGTLIRTDVAVLQTTKIAGAALKSLKINQAPEDFLKNYTSVGLTNNVLQLTVKGTTDADAITRAKALSEAFIADHVQQDKAAATAAAQALLDQRKQVQADLGQVDSQISQAGGDTGSGSGNGANATALETLYARRAQLTAQVSDLGNQAQAAGVGTPSVAAGTEVVDAARIVVVSRLKTGATDGLIGLLVGFALGLAVAAVTGIVRDRPVLRREIATHLGASVIGQLPAPHRGPSRLWRRSRSVADRKRVAVTLVRAIRDAPGAVSLLELGDRRTTAALALHLAEELAIDGPVVVVDDLPGANLRTLAGEPESPIRIIDGTDRKARDAAENGRRIGVGSVAPGTAWTDLTYLGAETLLVVRAGHANTAWLHTVARQLADCQIAVIGVVLVDPDPRDHSDGTLWDGLRTALRGRAGRVQTPARPVAEREPAKPVEVDKAVPAEEVQPVAVNGSATVNGNGVNGNGVNGNGADGFAGGDHQTKTFAPVKPSPTKRPVEHWSGSHSGDLPSNELPTRQFGPVQPPTSSEDVEVW
jgi:Chain length determinant protein